MCLPETSHGFFFAGKRENGDYKMYYTMRGAYRKSKMFIDYANIVLTVAIVIGFIIILFLRSRSGLLFPIELFMGALVNGLSSAKQFMNDNKLSGILLIVVTVVLLVLSFLTLMVVTR
ncbi:MAG: hypothetical protein Q4F06_06495 [Eubacteriales bacterium]|nr:hypothetical protein [Eubacteriales bacterium]